MHYIRVKKSCAHHSLLYLSYSSSMTTMGSYFFSCAVLYRISYSCQMFIVLGEQLVNPAVEGANNFDPSTEIFIVELCLANSPALAIFWVAKSTSHVDPSVGIYSTLPWRSEQSCVMQWATAWLLLAHGYLHSALADYCRPIKDVKDGVSSIPKMKGWVTDSTLQYVIRINGWVIL